MPYKLNISECYVSHLLEIAGIDFVCTWHVTKPRTFDG